MTLRGPAVIVRSFDPEHFTAESAKIAKNADADHLKAAHEPKCSEHHTEGFSD